MKVAITGSSGFVGQALIKHLSNLGHTISIIKRNEIEKFKSHQKNKYDVLIHLAARAHVMHENTQDVYKAYTDVNIEYTSKIAELSKHFRVKRFIFLSSVKVNGEQTFESPYCETTPPSPEDAYGSTKFQAELLLQNAFKKTNTELVIIRSPLVYGKGVKANFGNLIKLSKLPLPLPLGAVKNKRSMIYIGNLIDFISICISHPNAGNQTFMVSDDCDISTTELIRLIRECNNMPPWLIPIPQSLIIFILDSLGKTTTANRLLGSLQVDISKAKRLLNWKPPYTLQQGILESTHGINS